MNNKFHTNIKYNLSKAAKATILPEFQEIMNIIKTSLKKGVEVYNYLMAYKEHWANIHFPILRYDVLTSNSAESFNSKISEERLGSYLYVFTSFSDKMAAFY